jgi:hypothetical protein
MLRIFLFGLSKRHIQPERYMPFALKMIEGILTGTVKSGKKVYIEMPISAF